MSSLRCYMLHKETVLIFSNVLAEFKSPAFDGSYLESELFNIAKNNHRGNWELVPGFLEFQGHCDVFPGNLAAVLLELEGGGDLLVDGPGKGRDVLLELEGGGDLLVDGPGKSGHHASSQHSWCQTHSKSTNSSLPVDGDKG